MSKFINKQKDYFDKISCNYDIDANESKASRYEFNTLIQFMGKIQGARILDLGCGQGRNSIKFSKYAKEVVGIDISQNSIRKAIRFAEEKNIDNFRAYVSDFKKADYKEYFDYIVCVNMFHHTDQLATILANIKSSLKKSGSLIIFENNPLNILFIPYFLLIGQLKAHLSFAYLRSNRYSLVRILNQSGFHISMIQKYGFLPTLLYNYWEGFIFVNRFLNKIPFINAFTAFHIIKAQI